MQYSTQKKIAILYRFRSSLSWSDLTVLSFSAVTSFASFKLDGVARPVCGSTKIYQVTGLLSLKSHGDDLGMPDFSADLEPMGTILRSHDDPGHRLRCEEVEKIRRPAGVSCGSCLFVVVLSV